MRLFRSVKNLGFLFLFFVLLASGTACASQSGNIFVSPRTGVGVGSVWGVFVGVSTYQDSELNLTYAHKDAEALHQFFVTQFQGKVPADQFKLLTNDYAKRGQVLLAVKEVLRRAQREDLVILFFAMQGLLDTTGQNLYFLTHDADPSFPEDDAVSGDDILRQIHRSKARNIVLMLDANHTGAIWSSGSVFSTTSAKHGTAVLYSSSVAERSQEGKQFCGGHGAFTCALLTGLKGEADANSNTLIELRELIDYTYRAVKESTDGSQNPYIAGSYDNGLPLAFALGWGGSNSGSIESAGVAGRASTEKLDSLQDGSHTFIQQRKQNQVGRLDPLKGENQKTAAENLSNKKGESARNSHSNIDFGLYHALVIGNEEYLYLDDLQTAGEDAEAVARVLQNEYGFTVHRLLNGTRDQIIEGLDRLRGTLTRGDNLLIYYAGHGVLDRQSDRGYWLPVDAKEFTRSRWISSTDIADTLKAMNAKHVIVVADSCYSGTLVRDISIKLKSSLDLGVHLQRTSSKRSRTALTSGALEPVLDGGGGGHSVFAKYFLQALQENQEVLEGEDLYMRIKKRIRLNAEQKPRYGDIRFTGHELDGDFLFVRKRTTPE